MKQRTLKDIRRDAPTEDRNCAALRVTPLPFRRPASTRYVRTSCIPDTLEDLHIKCGRFGVAAVAHAKWCAVTSWLVKDDDTYKLTHSASSAQRAVWLCSNEEQFYNFPRLTDHSLSLAIANLTDCEQVQTRSIARETVEDWDRCGQQRLQSAILHTYQCILSYIRHNPKVSLKETN